MVGGLCPFHVSPRADSPRPLSWTDRRGCQPGPLPTSLQDLAHTWPMDMVNNPRRPSVCWTEHSGSKQYCTNAVNLGRGGAGGSSPWDLPPLLCKFVGPAVPWATERSFWEIQGWKRPGRCVNGSHLDLESVWTCFLCWADGKSSCSEGLLGTQWHSGGLANMAALAAILGSRSVCVVAGSFAAVQPATGAPSRASTLPSSRSLHLAPLLPDTLWDSLKTVAHTGYGGAVQG